MYKYRSKKNVLEFCILQNGQNRENVMNQVILCLSYPFQL